MWYLQHIHKTNKEQKLNMLEMYKFQGDLIAPFSVWSH